MDIEGARDVIRSVVHERGRWRDESVVGHVSWKLIVCPAMEGKIVEIQTGVEEHVKTKAITGLAPEPRGIEWYEQWLGYRGTSETLQKEFIKTRQTSLGVYTEHPRASYDRQRYAIIVLGGMHMTNAKGETIGELFNRNAVDWIVAQ